MQTPACTSAPVRIGAAEQRVSDYMQTQGRAILSMSVRDIAQACGVSEATVVRCCRRAGCIGLKDYKIALISRQEKDSSALPITGGESISELREKIFDGCIKTMRASSASLSDAALDMAIRMLTTAGNIDVYAVGGSVPIASYMRHQFIKLGIRVGIYSDRSTIHLTQSRLGSSDVVIAISCSGSTPDVLDALVYARDLGARTICLTSAPNSPMAQAADVCLLTSGEHFLNENDNTYARLSQLAVVDILYAGLAIRSR